MTWLLMFALIIQEVLKLMLAINKELLQNGIVMQMSVGTIYTQRKID